MIETPADNERDIVKRQGPFGTLSSAVQAWLGRTSVEIDRDELPRCVRDAIEEWKADMEKRYGIRLREDSYTMTQTVSETGSPTMTYRAMMKQAEPSIRKDAQYDMNISVVTSGGEVVREDAEVWNTQTNYMDQEGKRFIGSNTTTYESLAERIDLQQAMVAALRPFMEKGGRKEKVSPMVSIEQESLRLARVTHDGGTQPREWITGDVIFSPPVILENLRDGEAYQSDTARFHTTREAPYTVSLFFTNKKRVAPGSPRTKRDERFRSDLPEKMRSTDIQQ